MFIDTRQRQMLKIVSVNELIYVVTYNLYNKSRAYPKPRVAQCNAKLEERKPTERALKTLRKQVIYEDVSRQLKSHRLK